MTALMGLYRLTTSSLQPFLGIYLQRRVRINKEDPKRLSERFGRSEAPRPSGKLIWWHAASVGESNALRPLINHLNRDYGGHHLITTGTKSSAELWHRDMPDRARHQYVPLDISSHWSRFLDHWQPDLAIMAESELWPNMLSALKKRNTTTCLVNARMSQRSFRRWQTFSGTLHSLLGSFQEIWPRGEEDAKRFGAFDATSVTILGDLKAASSATSESSVQDSDLHMAIGARPVWLAVSLHPEEFDIIAEAHQRLLSDLANALLIVLPRHPEKADQFLTKISAQGWTCGRRKHSETPRHADTVYLADSFGEVTTFSDLSAIAFVGGSLNGHGGQNPRESAQTGKPLLWGPSMENFSEIALSLINCGAARSCATADDIYLELLELFQHDDLRIERGRIAKEATRQDTDILQRHTQAILRLLNTNHA